MLIKEQNNNIETKLYTYAFLMALIIIASFGFYKVAIGEFTIAFIDFFICLLLSFAIRLIFIAKFTVEKKLTLVFLSAISILSIIYIQGTVAAVFWAFPMVTSIFFLLDSRLALPINILFIIASMSVAFLNISLVELINLFFSLVLVCISGYIFSSRAEVYHQQLQELVDIDPLTKLKNRHSLKQELINEITLHNCDIHTSSLIILDLDHFKKINDVYGHTTGDKTLVSFANILKTTVRESDKVYRYGGEEFIIIAKNTKLEKAGKLAEHLRKTTENSIIIDGKSVTVSIGVAEVRKGDTTKSWIHRADDSLYKAKESSRNAVFLAYSDNEHKKYQPEIEKKQLLDIVV